MITDINSAPATALSKWPMAVTWKYNGAPNYVECNGHTFQEELLHKLVDAQTRPSTPKVIKEIKYIKAKYGKN